MPFVKSVVHWAPCNLNTVKKAEGAYCAGSESVLLER